MRTSPALRRAGSGVLSALKRRSVLSLLTGSTLLVFFFCALVVVLLEAGRRHNDRMVGRLIRVDKAIAELCLTSRGLMSDARRYEKDFLLNYGEFGFEEAKARYITRAITTVLDIQGNARRIRDLADNPETTRLSLKVERELDRYAAGLNALAGAVGERGSPAAGVYGRMRTEALEMERLVAAGRAGLLARLLLVRRAEKNYLERTQDTDVGEIRKALAELDAAVVAARVPAAVRAELRGASDRYLALFLRYAQLTEGIRTIKRDYLRAVQQIDPLLETLYARALARVEASQERIERSARQVRASVAVFGGALLLLTALFSAAVVFTVTRSVAECRTLAERIASGDLKGRLAPEGSNEFSSLAVALNRMADSLEASVAALRESEERYRAFVETSTDWIWATDLEGRHTFSNERVREILGVGPEALLRRPAVDLLHPEDVPRVRDLLAASAASARGWQGVLLRWRHRDGSYRWLESNAVPAHDAQGALVGFRGTDRDVTERQRFERERLKTQKLEAIGTLAGGLAHDFNNLLQGLFGYLTLARLRLQDPERAAEMLTQAERALTLSVNLTTQLLTFAKGGRPQRRRLLLPAVLEDPVRFALSGSRSDYRITFGEDVHAVDADPGQIGQVIQNLVLNASEAMPQGGTVEIAVRNESVPAGSSLLVPDGGEFVRIDVRDSGVGISGQNLARIFDPYFTTKQHGSGLGLATSYSIVRGHDGFIDVSSRPGEGSVFSVFLPAGADGKAGRETAEAAPAAAGPVTGRILVMDDEEVVRNVAAEMIAALGHDVVAAANGEEALEAYRRAREEGTPFDAVILDLTVRRGMGGEEAIRRLRDLDPAVRAVVSSGYSDSAVFADYRSHGFAAVLNKPYRMDALRDCLRSLLQPR